MGVEFQNLTIPKGYFQMPTQPQPSSLPKLAAALPWILLLLVLIGASTLGANLNNAGQQALATGTAIVAQNSTSDAAQKDSAASLSASATAFAAKQSTQNAKLQSTLSAQEAVISKNISEIKDLNILLLKYQTLDCSSLLTDVDFTSKDTISKILDKIVGDQDGKILSASWNILWSDSKTSMYKVIGAKRTFYFLVFFDDPATGSQPLIMDVKNHCVLARGKSPN
jgi:hypothetical protein